MTDAVRVRQWIKEANVDGSEENKNLVTREIKRKKSMLKGSSQNQMVEYTNRIFSSTMWGHPEGYLPERTMRDCVIARRPPRSSPFGGFVNEKEEHLVS